jgi:hypothetical protein
MRRRRYLQAAALGASGLAGCNALDQGTETPTATPTPTESPTATPGQGAPSVDPPAYMELLPKEHLKGTEETPNANFVRVDWDWYLSNYDTEMQFGATSEENWTLEANAGNLNERPPPKYRLLHTPVGVTIQTAGIVANIIPEFPNLGPELVSQCGMEMINESGNADSRATYTGQETAPIEEILTYAAPGYMYFIGVDVESLAAAVKQNDQSTPENHPDTTLYSGEGRMSARGFFLSKAWDRSLLLVETADSKDEAVIPAFNRVTGTGATAAVASLNSVQWCLSKFDQTVPIQVGQIRGGRAKFGDTTYVHSPIRSLDGYDSVLNGLNIQNGSSARSQVVVSNVERTAPAEEQLLELYGPNEGTVEATSHDSVSELSATWDR